jgi:hypothetical protein
MLAGRIGRRAWRRVRPSCALQCAACHGCCVHEQDTRLAAQGPRATVNGRLERQEDPGVRHHLILVMVASCKVSAPAESAPAEPVPKGSSPESTLEEPLKFHCWSRLIARNWDGKYAGSVSGESHCSTTEVGCDPKSSVGVQPSLGIVILQTPCVATEHAFCFDFVDTSTSDKSALQEVRSNVKSGGGHCALSWYDCHEMWLHPDAGALARQETVQLRTFLQKTRKTECAMF